MRHAAALVLFAAFALPTQAAPQTAYKGHGAESVPAEVIATYAPKPLPPDLARRIQSLMDVRAPGLGQPSPDGSRLFFGWSVTGTAQVWRLDGPNTFPVQLTGGEDRTTLADVFPDGKTLVLQRDRKGEENPGLYVMPAAGGPLTEVQHVKGVQTFFQFVSADGKWVYYAANDQKPDSYAIYRWNVDTKQKEALVTEPGLWFVADHRDDGTLLLSKATGSLTSEYWEWSPATKKLTPILGQDKPEEYTAVYGATPGQLLVLTPKLGEFRRLCRYEGGKLAPLTGDLKWDVSGFSVDEAKTRVLYTVNEAGYTKLFALDAKTLQPVALPKLPEGVDHVYNGSTTRNGRFTTFGVETATAPADLVRLRLADRLAHALGRSEHSRGRHGHLRGRDARALPGEGRHDDPRVREAAEELHPGALPGRRRVPRRSRGAGAARLLHLRAGVRRRRLRLRRAERPRQRRLRPHLARRRQRGEAPEGLDRHRGRGDLGEEGLRGRREGRRRSGSREGATAATPRSSP